MTAEHVIFIPGVLLLGLSIGYALGARAILVSAIHAARL